MLDEYAHVRQQGTMYPFDARLVMTPPGWRLPERLWVAQ